MRHHTRECGHHGDYGLMGRHRGGRGFGRLMAGLAGGAGMGARGFGAGRKLGADDLQLIILALLAEEARHGYEIIKALEERSSGFYSPSPGMVYPALTYLEELGYATVEVAGAKKLYRITATGNAYLEENKAVAQSMLEQLAWIGRRMEQMRRAFTGEEAEDAGPGTHAELHEARHALRSALRERRAGGPEEERRIAEILRRAADEIRGK
ncbi:MAG TPA: PadR family transcriptional regulator [Alphaproteobacteria bacterium]|nr:PadR family transcriptional regulator [Alphaproteobacteria bacterium]